MGKFQKFKIRVFSRLVQNSSYLDFIDLSVSFKAEPHLIITSNDELVLSGCQYTSSWHMNLTKYSYWRIDGLKVNHTQPIDFADVTVLSLPFIAAVPGRHTYQCVISIDEKNQIIFSSQNFTRFDQPSKFFHCCMFFSFIFMGFYVFF